MIIYQCHLIAKTGAFGGHIKIRWTTESRRCSITWISPRTHRQQWNIWSQAIHMSVKMSFLSNAHCA